MTTVDMPSEPVVTQPAPAKSKKALNNPYIWGLGRRKTSVARVRIRPGTGKFEVNDKEMDAYFNHERDRGLARQPLEVTDTAKSYDVFVNVAGGGYSGQTGAVVLGLARALVKVNPEFGPKLREAGLLTRDSREVERKKYGQAGARRRFQFSKR